MFMKHSAQKIKRMHAKLPNVKIKYVENANNYSNGQNCCFEVFVYFISDITFC